MDQHITHPASKRIHPLVAAAAICVILVSLIGVAAMTGLLPNSSAFGTPPAASTGVPLLTADDKLANDVVMRPDPALREPALANQPPMQPPMQLAQSVPAPRPVVQPRVVTPDPVYIDEPREAPLRVAAACVNCGRVEAINTVERRPERTSGIGVAAGAVLGGLLGNQIGGGHGRQVATVAGAVGGSLAGNEVEKRTNTVTEYVVRVRMDNGKIRTFPFRSAPGYSVGQRVEINNGHLTARG